MNGNHRLVLEFYKQISEVLNDMTFGNIKKSIGQAVSETLQSDEFKDSMKNVVKTTLDEVAEVVEKVVDSDDETKED